MAPRLEVMSVGSGEPPNLGFLLFYLHGAIDRTLCQAIRGGFRLDDLFVVVDSTGSGESLYVGAATRQKLLEGKGGSERYLLARGELLDMAPVSGTVRTLFLSSDGWCLAYFHPALKDVCSSSGGSA